DGNDAIHIVPDSRNQPAEFTENRFPVIVERLGLSIDSGGAGEHRGGLGYDKHYRVLVDCHTIVTADRVRLGCYGVAGGKAGEPFCVTVDLHGAAKALGGLVDGAPVKAGQVVRVVTTGGGGWGDPLERAPDLVLRDVVQQKVSPEAARREYGVVLVTRDAEVETAYTVDAAVTAKLRDELRAARNGPLPLIDRGPGYDKMLRGEFGPRV
ncbi:MAG: hydantoinase B/oxoprolinase family protein, partial [Burkholderiales bacterium]